MPRTVDPTIPPVHVDGFDDLRLIGRGGFSYVFSARQRDFNRRVALKVLAFGLVDERERRSFERECRAMGLVSQHPHIVTVFNAAFSDHQTAVHRDGAVQRGHAGRAGQTGWAARLCRRCWRSG